MGDHGDIEPRVRRHAPLSGIRGLLQCMITWCKSSCPLSGVKRCPLFGGSGYIGGSASAKVRCGIRRPGDVRYFNGVSVKRGSTVDRNIGGN